MITTKPGDIFRDKDPRTDGRHLKVLSADSRFAYLVHCTPEGQALPGRRTRVSLRGLETRFERVGGSRQREDLERAALKCLKEWRAAEKRHQEIFDDEALMENDRAEWDRLVAESFHVFREKGDALRTAADRLSPGAPGEEG